MKFISLFAIGSEISHIFDENLHSLCGAKNLDGTIPTELFRTKEEMISLLESYKDPEFIYEQCKECSNKLFESKE